MAKGTSEPPSFQCQKCQYGFNIDWCKTNLEVIFGLPSPTSSFSTSTSPTYKPTSAPYHRPPAPYLPHHTTYHPANVPPPRYPPPVATPPPPPHLSTYHPYPPTYPGYYGYYPPAPIPPPHVPYPGYPLPGIPPPGVPPPLGYAPPGVPPISSHAVPPPNPWGAIPSYPGMYSAHAPYHPPPLPPRAYHLPPAGRPWPPSSQYPRQPRPPQPWHQRPGPPPPMAAEPVQEESTPAPDPDAEKSKVVAARFELLLNQIDQAKARVRHEKEVMKEFQKEMATNSNEQPSHEEEPNALTDEGQKSVDYDEKPPGDDSEAGQGDVYLGFGSVVTISESQSGPPGEIDVDLPLHEATEEPSGFPPQSDTHDTSGDSRAVSRESVEVIPYSSHNTTEQPSDDASSFADDIPQACAQSGDETYESSQRSVVLESEDDSQTLSTDDVPSSSEPSTRGSSSVDTLPRRGRRSAQPRKPSGSPAAQALESPRQTRRSWRNAGAVPAEKDTDSTATEEESLPLSRRLRKSRRNKLPDKQETKTVAKGFNQVNDKEVGLVGSGMETGESLDVVCQHNKTESDSVTLFSNSDQFFTEAETTSDIISHEVVNQAPSENESLPENMLPEPPTRSPDGPKTLSEEKCLEGPNASSNEPDTLPEDISPMTPDQRGRKTRGRKRKQQASDTEGLVSVSATRKSARVSAAGGTAEGHSKKESEKELEGIQAESEEESSVSTQHSEDASSMKRIGARRSQRVPASEVQQSCKDVLERHETDNALSEEFETQHPITTKDNLETESYLQTFHSNSVHSTSEPKTASKVIHPEVVNQSPTEPKTVYEVIPHKALQHSPHGREPTPEGMHVETLTQFYYGADTPLDAMQSKTSYESQHGPDTPCEEMHLEAPNKSPNKQETLLEGMPPNQPHSEPEIASEDMSPVEPKQHGKTRGRKRKQQGSDKEGPVSVPATRRSARISAGSGTAEEHPRQGSKKEVENIPGESEERSGVSTQHNEVSFSMTSPMERRPQGVAADEFHQPDQDVSHDALPEKSDTHHQQTVEDSAERDTTGNEHVLKRQMVPKYTKRSLRSSLGVDEQVESVQTPEVSTSEGGIAGAEKQTFFTESQVTDKLVVPSESESEAVPEKTTRRTRRSVLFKDQLNAGVAEQKTNIRRTQNSSEVSQEPETSKPVANPSIHQTRRSSPLTEESETQETKKETSSRLTEEVVLTPPVSEARTSLDATQPGMPCDEEQSNGNRTSGALKMPGETQLSSQDPGSSETDDSSIIGGKRKSVRLVLQEPQLSESEKTIGRGRKRKSLRTSTQQPESSETEEISNRRQTRKFTRISQASDTLIHEKEPADRQEAFTAFEKESNSPVEMEEDKTVHRSPNTSSEMTEGAPSNDEDFHLSQDSDTLKTKAEVSSLPRTRKSRKSSGVTDHTTKAPFQSSGGVDSSEGRGSSRRTRNMTKSTPVDKEIVNVSQESDCSTSVEGTQEESPVPQGMVAGDTEETTGNVTKRITRSRRKKNP